jgi:hypothetical protein
VLKTKTKLLDIIKWIFVLPLSFLFAEIAKFIIHTLIDYIEIYLFGKDFFHYYWSLFCVAIYGATFGFFLSATTYFIAPSHKKRCSFIILTLFALLSIYSNIDFSNEYFYIRLSTTLIIGLLIPSILEEENQNSFVQTSLSFFGLTIIGIWAVGSLVLHIWTVILVSHDYGSFAGLCSFFLPVISEVVYLFKLWNAHDGYVKLFFLVLIFYFIKSIMSKILSATV